MKLNAKAFAVSAGIFCGLALLFITWWMILFEGQTGEITRIGQIYRGYNISISGSFIGLVWGFFDGLIWGYLFAILYNYLTDKMSPKTE